MALEAPRGMGESRGRKYRPVLCCSQNIGRIIKQHFPLIHVFVWNLKAGWRLERCMYLAGRDVQGKMSRENVNVR